MCISSQSLSGTTAPSSRRWSSASTMYWSFPFSSMVQKTLAMRIEYFNGDTLRTIKKIRWYHHISNKELRVCTHHPVASHFIAIHCMYQYEYVLYLLVDCLTRTSQLQAERGLMAGFVLGGWMWLRKISRSSKSHWRMQEGWHKTSSNGKHWWIWLAPRMMTPLEPLSWNDPCPIKQKDKTSQANLSQNAFTTYSLNNLC